MFNTAFCPKSNHLAEKMDGKTINWMQEISKQKNCAIAGTLMIKENEKVFNNDSSPPKNPPHGLRLLQLKYY